MDLSSGFWVHALQPLSSLICAPGIEHETEWRLGSLSLSTPLLVS
jgi:hypothetical protein